AHRYDDRQLAALRFEDGLPDAFGSQDGAAWTVDAYDERLQIVVGKTLLDQRCDRVAAGGARRSVPVYDHPGDGDHADWPGIFIFRCFANVCRKLDLLIACELIRIFAAELRKPRFESLAIRNLVDEACIEGRLGHVASSSLNC